MTWTPYRVAPGLVHVVPDHDVIDHESGNCVCGPLIEQVVAEDGQTGLVFVHHSLDNREAAEGGAA